MLEKFKEVVSIVSQEQIATDIFSLWIQTTKIAEYAKPGQFVSMYTNDRSKILPRPISICEIQKKTKRIRVVYRVTGAETGTKQFSQLQTGDTIEILGPLGNGFPLKEKKAFVIGGGIGIPPMLELSKNLTCEKQIILGYRDEVFLQKELEEYGKTFIATEDGTIGTKGNVLDAIKKHNLEADIIYACGPTPMLRAVKEYAIEHQIECYISMEERMACGIGACLACVCKSKEKNDHSQVHNQRVCKEGPVFLATEVDL
ncbi:dihydroorotate dehydrogenase electron transfer subunit [Lachnospiraceae bacterium LCP25S3_G4]